MRALVLAAVLLLGACSNQIGDSESQLCREATSGLPDQEFANCWKDISNARWNAWQEAAQVYRNKPRPRV